MENKTAKTRIILGGGAIASPLNFLFSQKISVRDEKLNQKSKNPFKNLAVMLNLFQHLINKHSLKKDLCLLQSNEDGQMLKQVQHDKSLMFGWGVLSDNDDKRLNKLINQEPENNAKIKLSCRTRFGIYPINDGNNKFDIFYFKILTFIFFFFGLATQKRRKQNQKKKKRRLRYALTVNLCNISFKKETGCAFNKVRWAQAAPLKPLTKSGALAPEPPCIHSLIHVLTKIFSETISSVG